MAEMESARPSPEVLLGVLEVRTARLLEETPVPEQWTPLQTEAHADWEERFDHFTFPHSIVGLGWLGVRSIRPVSAAEQQSTGVYQLTDNDTTIRWRVGNHDLDQVRVSEGLNGQDFKPQKNPERKHTIAWQLYKNELLYAKPYDPTTHKLVLIQTDPKLDHRKQQLLLPHEKAHQILDRPGYIPPDQLVGILGEQICNTINFSRL